MSIVSCPHCGVDLAEGPGSRVIGVEIPGVYDGVLYWQCPDCGGAWNRWDREKSPHRWGQAESWMNNTGGGGS